MKEHTVGLLPWAVLVFALVVPNPFKLALDPAYAGDASRWNSCSKSNP